MQNGNLHLPKKFGLYQRAVDLYLWRWIKDAWGNLTFTEEVWIIPTRGAFVPMKMNKRCRMEIYIYRRSLDYTNERWICTYEGGIKDAWGKLTFTEEVWIIPTRGGFVPMKMNKRCMWGNLHFPKRFGLYQRAVDFYLWRWIKDAEWKFTFTEEVWIIPMRWGFVRMKINKRCRMEIYIYRRSLDYTNARWICTYDDE